MYTTTEKLQNAIGLLRETKGAGLVLASADVFPLVLAEADATLKERVFTESEMKAYVNEMFRAHSDPGYFIQRHTENHALGNYEETISQWVARAKAYVSHLHGVSDLT